MQSASRILLTAGVLASLLAPGVVLSAPAPRPSWAPAEANGLRLELHSGGRMSLSPSGCEGAEVTLAFTDLRRQPRSLRQVIVTDDRLESAWGVTYRVWFPDGTVLELEPASGPVVFDTRQRKIPPPRSRPLAIPAGGVGFAAINLCGTQDFPKDKFWTLFQKHKGQFCLTAVVSALGLQSNLIRYNGCPEPPYAYTPLRHSRFSPEAVQRRQAQQKQGDPRDEARKDLDEQERLFHELELRRLRRMEQDQWWGPR